MRRLYIPFALLILALVSPATGQDGFKIRDFSGGANFDPSPFRISDSQGSQFWNTDLSPWPGLIQPRPGYVAVTDSNAAYSKIWSIEGHKFSNGDAYLFQVDQRADSGWADLRVSAKFGYEAAESLFSYIYPGPGRWVTWLDNAYYFNGVNTPIVIQGGPSNFKAKYLFSPGPGQLIATPINRAANIKGEVMYAVVTRVPGSSTLWSLVPSSYSMLINPYNEAVLLRNFYPARGDSTHDTPDTTDFLIVKTRANHNDYATDSLFIVDSLYQVPNTYAYLQAVHFVDTVSNLTGRFFKTIAQSEGGTGYPTSNECNNVGGPTFLEGNNGTGVDTIISGPGFLHVYYGMTYMDTLSHQETDMGRAGHFTFFAGPTDTITIKRIKILLPPPMPGYYRVLYRKVPGVDFYCLDTITSSADSVAYVDYKGQNDLVGNNDAYVRKVLDAHLKGAIVHEARMFAWDDYRLYMSYYDTAGYWSIFDNVEADLDDGDRVQTAASREGYVLLYKSNSIYLFYTNDGFVTLRSKKSPGIGVFAPFSLAEYNGQGLFLDRLGVSLELGNLYRDQSLARNYISDPIKSVLVRDAYTMQTAQGAIAGNNYLLSYPGTDTTFVYSMASKGWSLWSFDFLDMCLYDTAGGKDYFPFNQTIFVRPDDSRIFLLTDTAHTDDGQKFKVAVSKVFTSGTSDLILPSFMNLWTGELTADSTDSLEVLVTGDKGDTLAHRYMPVLDSKNYHYLPLGNIDNGSAHFLELKLNFGSNPFILTGYDFQVSPAGPDKEE